jgi:hypothetical protein
VQPPVAVERCKLCGGRCGSIHLTEAEEVRHFGHVLSDEERGFCSQRCQRIALLQPPTDRKESTR